MFYLVFIKFNHLCTLQACFSALHTRRLILSFFFLWNAFEFVFSELAFTCYGLINTTGEREIDPGTRKCEEEMISALNKRPCQCLWRYCFLTMQRTALSQSDSLWSIEKRISMFSKEGKQRPVYQKHVPVLNLLLMVSDILLYILWSLILGYEYLAKWKFIISQFIQFRLNSGVSRYILSQFFTRLLSNSI